MRRRGWFPSGKTHRHRDSCTSRDNLVWSCRCPAPDNPPAFHPPAHSLRPSRRCGFVHKSGFNQVGRQTPPSGPKSAGADELRGVAHKSVPADTAADGRSICQPRCAPAIPARAGSDPATVRGRAAITGAPVRVGPVNVFSANDPAAQKTARLIIQLLADFLADATPGFRAAAFTGSGSITSSTTGRFSGKRSVRCRHRTSAGRTTQPEAELLAL